MKMDLLWLVPLFLLGFTVVHLSKMMRLYVVLLEQKIEFKRFVLTYLKTTFVNLLIPFKLGEIYRIYCFSRETKVFQIGLCSVLVDRFFDTAALLLLLIPFELFITGNVTLVTGILTIVSVLAIFVFAVFLGIYRYLNRYIIMNKTSKRSMTALKSLEVTKEWYDYVKNLVAGRYALITLLSCLAWLVEIGVLWCLASICTIKFGISAFSDYIAAIFMSGSSQLLRMYTLVSLDILAILTMIAFVVYHTGRNRKMRSKNNKAGE